MALAIAAAQKKPKPLCLLVRVATMKLKEYWWFILLGIVLLFSALTTFDTRTEAFLAQLEPGFRLKVRGAWGVIKLTLGLRPYPTSGRRSAAEQAALSAKNPTKVPNGTSKPSSHQTGHAMDCNYLDATGKNVLMQASSDAAWAPVVKIYKQFGLRWGGTFSGYKDRVHIDDL